MQNQEVSINNNRLWLELGVLVKIRVLQPNLALKINRNTILEPLFFSPDNAKPLCLLCF
jgi:hypothetical protein